MFTTQFSSPKPAQLLSIRRKLRRENHLRVHRFRQKFVATIPVVADRGRANVSLGIRQTGERITQQLVPLTRLSRMRCRRFHQRLAMLSPAIQDGQAFDR